MPAQRPREMKKPELGDYVNTPPLKPRTQNAFLIGRSLFYFACLIYLSASMIVGAPIVWKWIMEHVFN